MPTKLGNFLYRRFDPQGNASRAKGLSLGSPKTAWLRGPWPGWEPDLEPSQASPGAASDCANLIDHDGILSQQNGYEKVGSATLPLGGTSPPDIGSEEPVVCIQEGRTASTQAIRRYAMTSDTSANGRGHFYELSSGSWAEVQFDANGTGLNAFTGDSSDPASTLVDAVHFPVGDYTIFGSGGANPLYRFPGLGTPTKYEPLTNLGSLSSLRANSVCQSEERIHAFGTTEGGTYYPARWRWTSKGANAQFDPSQTGAGFADLNEFGGEGLAVRNIGPKVALYLTNGVLFAKRTGTTSDPFQKDYADYSRGLLSTRSVVDLGNGVHFGLFTDGWFLLSYDGRWEEKGTTDKGYHKWHSEFYSTLDWANRKRVTIDYDPGERVVYIAFPQAGATGNAPSTVWLYSLQTDTLWPAPDYAKLPNIFGHYTEETNAGYAWSAMTAAWAATPGSWGSYETQVGRLRVQYGTGDGYIYTHRPDLVTRDGVLPTYRYRSHFFSGGRPDLHKRFDTIHLNYTRVQGNGVDPTPITGRLENENGTSQTEIIEQTLGEPGTVQTDFVSGAVSGLAHRFTLSGQAPVKINGIGLQIYEEEAEGRKEGAV